MLKKFPDAVWVKLISFRVPIQLSQKTFPFVSLADYHLWAATVGFVVGLIWKNPFVRATKTHKKHASLFDFSLAGWGSQV